MGKAFSLDLRGRIAAYVAQGRSAQAAASIFGGSASTAVRIASAYRRGGGVAPKRQGRAPGSAGKLAAHIGFLVERVKLEPDITVRELAEAFKQSAGVEGRLSSIHRALIRSGLS